jgi:SPP1 family predicted phage head-tail adaptor
MRAGALDRRLTIQRATTTPNAFNEPVASWTDVATVWAQPRPNRGAERFAAQQIVGQGMMTFQIRYRTDVRVTDRILYQGRIWNVLDVREVGRRAITEIDAVAEVKP